MPSKQTTQNAKHIFDDLRRNGYYADPATLGGFLKGPQGTDADGARAVVAARNDPRAVFVPTGFRSENATYGPRSYPWKLTITWLETQDPMAAARQAICQGDFRCTRASLGHPNVEGAKAIAEAIRPHLAR